MGLHAFDCYDSADSNDQHTQDQIVLRIFFHRHLSLLDHFFDRFGGRYFAAGFNLSVDRQVTFSTAASMPDSITACCAL
jgi:hypothetical protein